MFKLTFIGAGSTVFAKNILGDLILTEELGSFEIAMYDIDEERLNNSFNMVCNINRNYNGKAVVKKYLNRREALSGADFIVNAIQVGGYKPCTVTDFEIPKKYGLKQTIADTLGIGGIFRALRTMPVLESMAEDIHSVAPKSLFINYTNPMAMLMGYCQRVLNLNSVGLCHSVQGCVKGLFEELQLPHPERTRWKIAGINHQAWLLEIEDEFGNDLYGEIKRRSKSEAYKEAVDKNKVRHDIMHKFGYYVTESSIHSAEYLPYYIKDKYPELMAEFNLKPDVYLESCENLLKEWVKIKAELVDNKKIVHEKSFEFAPMIVNSVVNDKPSRVHGNVVNKGLIDNLPQNACVEVPCLVDRNGINPCIVGALPEQLAALNRTNINVQLMVIEAMKTRKKEAIYQAAFLDPHTSSELSLDDIVRLCDDMIEAHGDWLPEFH